MTDTQWDLVPKYTFGLSGMTKPTQIIEYLKNLGIKHYLYAIFYKNRTVKIGMSLGGTTRDGERLYRQLGHLDSWGQHCIIGANGIEFHAICQHLELLHGGPVDHNDITVYIWDFTNYPWTTINKQYELEKAEQYLIRNYKLLYGELPIGNLYDYNPFGKKSAPNAQVYHTLFQD